MLRLTHQLSNIIAPAIFIALIICGITPAEAASAVRSGLGRLGFEMFTADDIASPVTTTAYAHPELPAADMQRFLMERAIFISGGLAALAGQIFRIGHMGLTSHSDIQETVDALKVVLPQVGFTKSR